MLTADKLEALRKFSTPTISNAIEMFDIRPRNVGFLGPEVRCLFPGLGRMIGYAFTASISADLPAQGRRVIQRHEYWQASAEIPAPRIAVIRDLDNPPGRGSFWGEVNSNIHRALGFIGTVTNGGARDLDEMEALGFFTFAGEVSVSHSYVHLVDYGTAVRVGGLVISPGDLLHGDRHGVIKIPAQVAGDLSDTALEVEEAERELINYCRSSDVRTQGLKEAFTRLEERFLALAAKRRASVRTRSE
jgi:4-hydroxy-4-methyl-2-oxoglutarate aldolase